MKYLLDTHTFLWTVFGTRNLSKAAKTIIEDGSNEMFVSTVSLWEISLKLRIGKLDLGNVDPFDLIDLAREMDFSMIELSPEEAIGYARLGEPNHNDPFDRMLIWQAINRDLIVISKDREFENFKPYGLRSVW